MPKGAQKSENAETVQTRLAKEACQTFGKIMAKKSSSGSFLTFGILAVGGYLAYENWPAISAWFGSIIPAAAPASAAAASGAYYPNSPVPASYSTMQTFVDSSGNQWQYSTQTGQWVIATPGPTPASPSAGTVVSTAPGSAAPAPITSVPAAPGTVVATTSPMPAPPPPIVRVAPIEVLPISSEPTPAPAPPPASAPASPGTIVSLAPPPPAPAPAPVQVKTVTPPPPPVIVVPRQPGGMPHYRSY
jgi:hypothetical protein